MRSGYTPHSGHSTTRPGSGTVTSLNVAMLLCLTGMVALWTLATALSHTAPDLDGMEELVWASSLELGYHKHPPLPSWIMHGLVQVFGREVWVTFFAGQLMSALALWFLWLFGKEITTPRTAFIAVLIGSTSLYFSLRGTIFNHNTAQLWSITASIWLFYRAMRYEQVRDWVWLGVVGGLATLTKYSAVIQFFAFFMFVVAERRLTDRSTLRGIGWAALAYGLTLLPHLAWLVSTQFLPFRYVDDALDTPTRLQALNLLLKFTLDQLARLSPMLIVWLGWWFWARRHPEDNLITADTPSLGTRLRPADKKFLLWVGLTPFLATALISAVLGTRLVASWGTTFFVLYSFFWLWALRGNPETIGKRILVLVVGVHLIMALGYAVARGPLAWATGRDSRSTFPGPDIAAVMNTIWKQHVPDVPLRLVASDTWLGGNIALHTGPQTQVFINGSYVESPWLNPDTAQDCGVLTVYSITSKRPPQPGTLRLMNEGTWSGVEHVRWSSEKSPLLDLNWSIKPPNERCALKEIPAVIDLRQTPQTHPADAGQESQETP
ncbi:MAG: glycosyltransferase family 39 protein [Alcaligenaceae bacterium]|nr:glycosyltransferase family 39 protein [Alcaligenaceae bacterium]